MKYGVISGGKKIRSTIIFNAGKMFNLSEKKLINIVDTVNLPDEKIDDTLSTFAKMLNNNNTFLQLLSIYNISSPLISLAIPILFLILPFVFQFFTLECHLCM